MNRFLQKAIRNLDGADYLLDVCHKDIDRLYWLLQLAQATALVGIGQELSTLNKHLAQQAASAALETFHYGVSPLTVLFEDWVADTDKEEILKEE